VKQWKAKQGQVSGTAFVPLSSEPADAMQFDWSLVKWSPNFGQPAKV